MIQSLIVVPPGILSDEQKQEMKDSGIMVVEAREGDAVQFLSAEPQVPTSIVLHAAFEYMAAHESDHKYGDTASARFFDKLAVATAPRRKPTKDTLTTDEKRELWVALGTELRKAKVAG